MANFLLLPSFHFKIRLAAFQLVAETVVVVVASAAAGVVARKRVANNLPLRAALVANLVSALSSEDSCGGWRTAAAGVEWLHLCLAGWHRHQTVLAFLLAPSCCSSPSQGKGFSQVELFVPMALVPGSVVDKSSPQVWLSGLHWTCSPLRELSRWAGDVLPRLELCQAPPLLRGDRHP